MTKIVKKQGTEMVKHLRPFDHKLSGGKQRVGSRELLTVLNIKNIMRTYIKNILDRLTARRQPHLLIK
jgi:hypothetical protein